MKTTAKPKSTPILTVSVAEHTVIATKVGGSPSPKTYTARGSANRAAAALAEKGIVTARSVKVGSFFYVAVEREAPAKPVRKSAGVEVQCKECGKRWRTTSLSPQCSKCNSVDVEPSIDSEPKAPTVEELMKRDPATLSEGEVDRVLGLDQPIGDAIPGFLDDDFLPKPPAEAEALFAAAREAFPTWVVGEHEPFAIFLHAPDQIGWWKIRVAVHQGDVRVLVSNRERKDVPVTTQNVSTAAEAVAYFESHRQGWTREAAPVAEVEPATCWIAQALCKGRNFSGTGATRSEAVAALAAAVEAAFGKALYSRVQAGEFPVGSSTGPNGEVLLPEVEIEPLPVVAVEDEVQVGPADSVAEPIELTADEATIIGRLTESAVIPRQLKGSVPEVSVERRSEVEFDLKISWVIPAVLDDETGETRPSAGSAWLPLAAINSLDWDSPRIAERTDYPEMALAGDWSGVRDTDRGRLWAIFLAELPILLGKVPAPRKPAKRAAKVAKVAPPAPKPVATEEAGRGYQLLGHSAAAVIRRLGAEGKTIAEAEALLARHGVSMGHKTISNLISRGRRWARRAEADRPAKWAPAPISAAEALAAAPGA